MVKILDHVSRFNSLIFQSDASLTVVFTDDKKDAVRHRIASALSGHGLSIARLQPIVTGATVVGLKYKDGVIVAADTLA